MFAFLQKFGKALMLPIALLPAVGILLGIGGAFTNPIAVQSIHAEAVLGEGTILNQVLTLFNNVGGAIFGNLPILFAAGVAAGLAKREKGVAVVAAIVGFLILHTTISSILAFQGIVEKGAIVDVKTAMSKHLVSSEADYISWAARYTMTVGIPTLQMSVFGGILTGVIVAALTNKFARVQFPDFFAFFGGQRFIPIITTFVFILVGAISAFAWPFIQTGITALGHLVQATGYFGSFIFGYIERSLIPFGLHHIFYLPFWQTDVGGTMTAPGSTEVISGAQKIFFAQLGGTLPLKNNHFEVAQGTRFMAGKFPFMMFGLWGVALAMYRTSNEDQKAETKGLVFSAAFTSFLTGITEPLEFSFLLAAPALYYGVHAVLAGLSFMLMHILNVGVGMTFSGGFIDFTLFGLIQGIEKTSWHWIVIVGVALFFVYWAVFEFAIKKFDIETPGRGGSLASKEEIAAQKYGNGSEDKANANSNDDAQLIDDVISMLGGAENIVDVDACITKLRVTVEDNTKVADLDAWKSKGAKGLIVKGKGIQAVYGPQADVIKGKIQDKLGL